MRSVDEDGEVCGGGGKVETGNDKGEIRGFFRCAQNDKHEQATEEADSLWE